MVADSSFEQLCPVQRSVVRTLVMGNQISKEQVVIPILGQHQHDGNDSITSLMENRQCRRRPRNLSRRVFLNAWIIIILLFHVGLVAPARAQGEFLPSVPFAGHSVRLADRVDATKTVLLTRLDVSIARNEVDSVYLP